MSAQDSQLPLLDACVRFDNLPATGRKLKVETTAEQRARIAGQLRVDSVDNFTATLDVMPIKGGIQVKGYLHAVVTQPCIVTFAPVSQVIEEEMNRVFLPGKEAEYTGPAGAEVFVDLEDENLPDYFEGPEVDFTDLLLETLALAINPYPRAPGATLPETADKEAEEKLSPFADLKHLKSTRD